MNRPIPLTAVLALGLISMGCSETQQTQTVETPPREAPESIADTAAWIAWYHPRMEYTNEPVFRIQCDSIAANVPKDVVRFVYSDTAFQLNAIDPKMSGSLSFDWEPLTNDLNGNWNMIGVHSFTVETEEGEVQVEDLSEVLEVEAWDPNDLQIFEVKELLFTDLNLDGYLDMRMKQFSGKSAYWCFYLFDPERGHFSLQFVDGIRFPLLDCQKRLIYTDRGGTAAGTVLRTLEIDSSGNILPVLDWSSFIKDGYDEAGRKQLWRETEYFDVRGEAHALLKADST